MKIFIIFSIVFSILSAGSSIDSLIEDIKQSHGDERRVKMNQLKLLLQKSNLEQRSVAIAKLREKLQDKKSKSDKKGSANKKEHKNKENFKHGNSHAGIKNQNNNTHRRKMNSNKAKSNNGSSSKPYKSKQGHK